MVPLGQIEAMMQRLLAIRQVATGFESEPQ
jgi:hypothetical protein